MQRTMLKSKLHRATVTEANLDYEGSITIDRNLMKSADIWPNEQVDVYNVTNGARFTTYAIEGPAGSGVICINGAAAHHAKEGHLVIIATYVRMEEKDIPGFDPKCILLGPGNIPKGKAL